MVEALLITVGAIAWLIILLWPSMHDHGIAAHKQVDQQDGKRPSSKDQL